MGLPSSAVLLLYMYLNISTQTAVYFFIVLDLCLVNIKWPLILSFFNLSPIHKLKF
jgi:hypothetical protein